MGSSVKRVLTLCSNGSTPLNKMAAMPIYGLSIEHWGLKVYQVCSNYGHRLIFYLFKSRSNCAPIHLYRQNVEKSFSQNVLKTNG